MHSIAAALFAKREQIQFFDEIGESWFVAADFSWRSVVRRFFFLSGDPVDCILTRPSLRLLPQPVHALSTKRGEVAPREVRMRPEAQL